jgi:plasmid stability protein
MMLLSAAQSCYGKSITIRDVPDETRNELAVRAARSGQSLQEYLRSRLIEIARRPDPESLIERIRKRKQHTASSLSRERILSHREADRR